MERWYFRGIFIELESKAIFAVSQLQGRVQLNTVHLLSLTLKAGARGNVKNVQVVLPWLSSG